MIKLLNDIRSRSSFSAALALVGAAWIVSMFLTNAAWAQQAQAPGGSGQRTPLPEALAACQSLTSGQACSFNAPRGAVTGTCQARQGKALSCRPDNAPPPPGGAASGPRP
jgi:hypothetical protein